MELFEALKDDTVLALVEYATLVALAWLYRGQRKNEARQSSHETECAERRGVIKTKLGITE